VRRIHRAAGARRRRRRAHTGLVEEVQQRLALDALDEDVRRPGDLVRRRHRLPHPRHLVPEAGHEAVAQRRDANDLGVALGVGRHQRGGQRDDPRDVVGAAAALALLTTTDDERVEGDAVAHGEHADALRAAELVGAQREQIDVPPDRAQVEPRCGLHGVGVQDGAGREPPDDGAHRGEVGHRADLVVDGHHAHDGDVVSERRAQRREVDATRRVDRDDGATGALDGVQHGVVLGGRADGAPTAAGDRTGDRRVVGLRAAPREDDLPGPAADDRGDVVAGLVDSAPRVTGEAVRSAGVGEALGEERQHRRDRVLAHRRRRRVVEVDQAVHARPR
jgi:hypothetical protein